MNTAPNIHVQVKQQFHASPERVFDSWLDPERIRNWMFGPALREEEIIRISIDPRVGGAFSFLVRRQGNESIISATTSKSIVRVVSCSPGELHRILRKAE
jgi:uncharacterized protein YndB with AHSA1/START domain